MTHYRERPVYWNPSSRIFQVSPGVLRVHAELKVPTTTNDHEFDAQSAIEALSDRGNSMAQCARCPLDILNYTVPCSRHILKGEPRTNKALTKSKLPVNIFFDACPITGETNAENGSPILKKVKTTSGTHEITDIPCITPDAVFVRSGVIVSQILKDAGSDGNVITLHTEPPRASRKRILVASFPPTRIQGSK